MSLIEKIYQILVENLTATRFFRFGIILGISLIIEMLVVGFRRSSIRDIFTIKNDNILNLISTIFLNFGLMPYLNFIFSFGVFYYYKDFFDSYQSYNLLIVVTNPILKYIFSLLIIDFATYWIHRMLHTVPFLWEFHKFHHSGKVMSLILLNRVHPMETTFRAFFYIIIGLLMGNSYDSSVFLGYLTQILSNIHHSKIPWKFGKIGDYVIVSPYAHLVHHSNHPDHYNKNLGFLTPMWDRVFGTWYHKGKPEDIEIGISDNYFNTSIFQAYIKPYKIVFNRIVISLSKRISSRKNSPRKSPLS